MKFNSIAFFVGIAAVTLGNASGQTPSAMLKIVVRDGLPENSKTFAALPKTIFLFGKQQGRIEELADPAQHLQELIVVNGKDSWLMNLMTKTGTHHTDPSPTNNFYAPIFMDAQHHEKVWTNEFIMGHELDYMKAHHVDPVPQSDGTNLFSTTISDLTVKVSEKAGVPTQVDILSGDHLIDRLVYDSYSVQSADPTLFSPPPDVAITDPESALKDNSFKSMADLGRFSSSYFLAPDPSKINDVIQFLQIGGLPNKRQEAPLKGFLQIVFLNNPDKLPGWKEEIGKTTGPTKQFFDKVLASSPDISAWPELKMSTDSAADNDFCWGGFLGSGDERFLKVLVERMTLLGYKTDMAKYLVGASAQWSLSSMSRQQPKVKEFLQKELSDETDHDLQKAIQETIDLDPSVIRQKLSSSMMLHPDTAQKSPSGSK